MQAQFVKGAAVLYRGVVSPLSGGVVQAAARGVVVRTVAGDRWQESDVVVMLEDGRRMPVMPSQIELIPVAALLPKV